MKADNIERDDVPPTLPRVPVARLVGHEGPVQAVRFTARGKYCVSGGYDRTVRLWNPSRLDPAFPPGPGGDPTSADGGGDFPLASLPRSLPIQVYSDAYTHPISAVAVDEESTVLLAGSDKTVVVTDVVTGQAKRRFQGHFGRINSVAIGRGAELFLSASYDATVRIWDGRSHSREPIQILKEAKDSVTDVRAVQDDAQALIRTASVDGVVRTYDVRRGIVKCDDNHSPITGMAPTRDGRCVAASCLDGNIRLCDAESGELLNSYGEGGRHHVAGRYGLECCVTADDATIVSGSEDGRAVLYDLVRGVEVQSLRGHSRAVCSIAAHPDPEFCHAVITTSYDGSAVVWAGDHDFMKWMDK